MTRVQIRGYDLGIHTNHDRMNNIAMSRVSLAISHSNHLVFSGLGNYDVNETFHQELSARCLHDVKDH